MDVKLREPTESELQHIERDLRLFTFQNGLPVPRLVRLAGDDVNAINAAWRNEALKFFYVAVRTGRV